MRAAFRRLLSLHLGVRRSDRVLILADRHAAGPSDATTLAAGIADAGRDLARIRFATYPETGRNGVEPPASAWRAAFGGAAAGEMKRAGILEPLIAKRAPPAQLDHAVRIIRAHRADAPQASLFITNWSATHTKFRWLLSTAAGAAVASCPGIRASMFRTAFAIDAKAMARRTNRVARTLNAADAVRIASPDGTSLSFSIKHRRAHPDDAMIKRGSFGNLPGGEAFVAPVEGSANGTLAVRAAPAGKLPSVMTFRITRGRAVSVTGGGATSRVLDAQFRKNPEFAVVAEFGVGTNPGATLKTNILESEKILGTIHIAFGDNATFGGTNKAAFHQDFLVFKPTVDLIGRNGRRTRLLDRGRLRE